VRSALLQRARSAADQLVALLYESGHDQAAIAVSDAMRGRSISDRRGAATRDGRLPVWTEGTIVTGHVTPGRVYLWSIRDGRVHARQVIERRELEDLLARYQSLVRMPASAEALRPVLASLYRLLLRPLLPMDHDDPIVFVPDAPLVRVPLASLLDERTDSHVIERSEVWLHPSLAGLTEELTQERSNRPHRGVMVVGVNGAWNQPSSLPPLMHAESEAYRVAERTNADFVLLGADADRTRVIEGLRARPGSFHFAGHAVANSLDPMQSYLLLGGTQGPDRLTLADLHALDLSGVALVVLSGCSTLDPWSSSEQASFGLAGAVLAAGARSVLATAAAVDDEAAAEMAIRFHSTDPDRPAASRLRRAIVTWLQQDGGETLAAWSAWMLVGAAGEATACGDRQACPSLITSRSSETRPMKGEKP
jgi:CHAT domain-containing protein